MPIAPKQYKLICPKCNYSKIVTIASDVLKPQDLLNMSTTCPNCLNELQKNDLNFFDKLRIKTQFS
jgi:hypothetical protein